MLSGLPLEPFSMKGSFMCLSDRAGHAELCRLANPFKIIWYWFCTSLYTFPVSGWKKSFVHCEEAGGI